LIHKAGLALKLMQTTSSVVTLQHTSLTRTVNEPNSSHVCAVLSVNGK